jgi:hypothetical protein
MIHMQKQSIDINLILLVVVEHLTEVKVEQLHLYVEQAKV